MKKRFIFDENYIKRYAKRNQIKWLVIGASALVLIIIIIVVLMSANRRRKKPVEEVPQPVFELKEGITVEAGANLPDVLDYFTKLENVDTDSITITYPEEFEIGYDMSTCTDEEIEKISNTEEYKVEDFACAVPILKVPATYGITLTVLNEEYTVNLEVIDTNSPVLVTKELEIFEKETYDVRDFVELCYDINGDCEYKFYEEDVDDEGNAIDYAGYIEPGEYTVKVVASDTYGNVTEPVEAKLTIVKVEVALYTIKFNSDGGSQVEEIKVQDGGLITEPIAPTKDGYKFMGWYFGTQKFDFTKPIDKNITITAKWEKIQGGNQNPSGGGTTNPKPQVDVSSVYLDYLTVYLTVGETKTVNASVKPSNATNKKITWSTSDKSIATVNNGKITGVKAGTATITATAGGKSSSVMVTVREKNATTCRFGDTTYNTSYILSVNLIKDGCAVNPNAAYSIDSVIGKDYQNAVLEIANMGLKTTNDYFEYRSTYANVKNKAGTGLVGKQITVTINVINPDNPYLYMTAQYVIKPDGSRQFIKNNIKKNNVTFQ